MGWLYGNIRFVLLSFLQLFFYSDAFGKSYLNQIRGSSLCYSLIFRGLIKTFYSNHYFDKQQYIDNNEN